MTETYWGVYRTFKNGRAPVYVARTVTSNEKLAREIAEDLSERKGIVHIAKPIEKVTRP